MFVNDERSVKMNWKIIMQEAFSVMWGLMIGFAFFTACLVWWAALSVEVVPAHYDYTADYATTADMLEDCACE